jgi:hypothetical protein
MEKIEEICSLIEEKIKLIKSFKIVPPREPITMSTTRNKFSALLPPPQIQTPIIYNLDIEIKDILRKPNLINETEAKTNKYKIIKEVHKSDLNQSNFNISKNYEKPLLTRSSVSSKPINDNSKNALSNKTNQSLIQVHHKKNIFLMEKCNIF